MQKNKQGILRPQARASKCLGCMTPRPLSLCESTTQATLDLHIVAALSEPQAIGRKLKMNIEKMNIEYFFNYYNYSYITMPSP